MTRLFSFGFENDDELLAFTQDVPIATLIAEQSFARTGTKSLEMRGASPNNYAISLAWNHEPTEIFLGSAIRTNTVPIDNWIMITFGVGLEGTPFSSVATLRWRTNNILQIYRGGTLLASSASEVFNPLNAFVHLQVWFKPLNTGGRFVVKVNDAIVIDFTGDTTDSQEYCDGIKFHALHNTGTTITYWDDVCINDSSGTTNNSYPGLARLQPVRVVGAGTTTQLSRGGIDLGANYRQVRESGEETFLQGSLDQLDLYTVDVPDLPAGAAIQNVITTVAGKSTSGSGLVASLVRGATTTGTGSDKTLTSVGMSIQEAWPLNPDDSAAWAEADLANLQIGIKVRS